jgi:hypothetical protein
MSRYDYIKALTEHEIKICMNNEAYLPLAVSFFSAGGFSRETDETLKAMYAVVFGESK